MVCVCLLSSTLFQAMIPTIFLNAEHQQSSFSATLARVQAAKDDAVKAADQAHLE